MIKILLHSWFPTSSSQGTSLILTVTPLVILYLMPRVDLYSILSTGLQSI